MICIQVDVAQEVMRFRHCGHCSAPNTADPPFLGAPVVGLAFVPDVLFPQAAATMPSTATAATARPKKRVRTRIRDSSLFPPAPPFGAARRSLLTPAFTRNGTPSVYTKPGRSGD